MADENVQAVATAHNINPEDVPHVQEMIKYHAFFKEVVDRYHGQDFADFTRRWNASHREHEPEVAVAEPVVQGVAPTTD